MGRNDCKKLIYTKIKNRIAIIEMTSTTVKTIVFTGACVLLCVLLHSAHAGHDEES